MNLLQRFFTILFVVMGCHSAAWGQYSNGRPLRYSPYVFRSIYGCGSYTLLHAAAGIEGGSLRDVHAVSGGIGTAWGFYLNRKANWAIVADINTTLTGSVPATLFIGTEASHPEFTERTTLSLKAASVRTGVGIGFAFHPHEVTLVPQIGVNGSVHYWGRGTVTTSCPGWEYVQHVEIFPSGPSLFPSARIYNIGITAGLMARRRNLFFMLNCCHGLLSATPGRSYSLRSNSVSLALGYSF